MDHCHTHLQGRGGPRRGEERGEVGRKHYTTYYLLILKASSQSVRESDKTSKFSTTRDMQSIQALSVASTVISLCPHTPTYTMLYALVQSSQTCVSYLKHTLTMLGTSLVPRPLPQLLSLAVQKSRRRPGRVSHVMRAATVIKRHPFKTTMY